ncbi:MAG TPA: zinc metalloprotease HtpX [Syntrophobacteraceae bacterium]|nr:zinc metalloprotease HtpX [Syntrophobacteraceae bacterium]
MIGNSIKTTLLLAALTVLILWIGRMVGGQAGMFVAFILALVMNAGSYWFSDKIVLAMYQAQPIEESQNPQLYQIVRELTAEANLPMPGIYMIPQQTPNAFATGRNPQHAVVAVTEGIMRILTPGELKGVLAHELGHVKNRDILVSSIAATLAGAIMVLANMAKWAAIFGGFRGSDDDRDGGGIMGLIVTIILAPIAAMLIQLAISRSREYLADVTGARLAHNSEGLARALEKLEVASERIPMDASPSTAHMFIVNPLSGSTLANLFSTHPPIEERIRRLRGM